MKNILTIILCFISLGAFAQMQVDKKIEMTGTTPSDKKIEGIEEVVNSHDAANKEYVDTAIANRTASSSGPSFTFLINTGRPTIVFSGAAGETDTTLVDVDRLTGDPGLVYLSVSGLPAGFDWELTPGGGIVNFNGVLELSTTTNIPTGSYTVTITGTGSGNTVSTTFDILVVRAKKVFRTATAWNGNLGGVSGANSKCQAAASAASLSGTFQAWIATTTQGPATLFSTQSVGPYELVNGTRVADNWADLTDGAIQNGIHLDENGNSQTGWAAANTNSDGTAWNSNTIKNCNNWTQGSSPYEAAGLGGGTSLQSGGTFWCYQSIRLLCFEQ